MRLAGDAEGCWEAVRALERCAVSVDQAQDRTAAAVSPFVEWVGTAADVWQGHLLRGATDVDATAEHVRAAAGALRTFADGLVQLQERARRLADEAASSRLVLDDAGWIAPVLSSAEPELLQEEHRRRAVRTAVLHGVRALQAEQDALHTGLVRALGQEVVRSPPTWSPASPWRPGPGDAAAAVLGAVATGLHQVADDGLRLLGRAAGSTVVGVAVTASTELAGGESPADVVLTTAAVTAGAQAGGALAMAGVAGVTLLAAPVVVPAGLGVAAVAAGGLVGGYVADRVWDTHGSDIKRTGGRLLSSARAWVDRPGDGRRGRR